PGVVGPPGDRGPGLRRRDGRRPRRCGHALRGRRGRQGWPRQRRAGVPGAQGPRILPPRRAGRGQGSHARAQVDGRRRAGRLPVAGKSSLVSVLSAAKPKIADYPFTTLAPNLGVVSVGEDTFTIADVPGLIPGAGEGRGLGLDFLRHIERTAVLVHVVDCAALESDRDPISDVDALEAELASYRSELTDAGIGDLADRPRVVVLNKIDVPDAAEMAEMVTEHFRDRGWPVFPISA